MPTIPPILAPSILQSCKVRLLMVLVWMSLGTSVCFHRHVYGEEPSDFFHKEVLPLLKDKCFHCHSHASGTMEGGLTLDWRSGWEAGGSRGTVLIPGNAPDSLILKAVRHEIEGLHMPEEKLEEEEIAILQRWVEEGAFDDRNIQPPTVSGRDWWSLRPLEKSQAPNPDPSNSIITNPIDAWIQQSLNANGLEFSKEASKRTLLRRVYYDLTGLPPSFEELQSFENDNDPQAYERIVETLLNSPRYGERWARHWMDTIHFADSHGYEHDIGRDNAWPFRDYVIESFNSDKPWDRFVLEQLAADYLFPEETSLIPALGFLGAGTFDLSTFSTAPITFDYLDRDDLVTQTMAAFTSTTANCARCHNHKFDPISQEDYYALQSVFAGVVKGDVAYDPDASVGRMRKQLTELIQAAERRDPQILESDPCREMTRNWLEDLQHRATWKSIQLSSFVSLEGATIARTDATTYLVSGTSPDKDTYLLTGAVDLPKISAIRLDVLPHESLPSLGPGRCQNGNLHLSEFEVHLFDPAETAPRKLQIARATADFNQVAWGIERAIDGDSTTAWGIHPAVAQPHHAVFELKEPVELRPGMTLAIILKQLHGGSHLIGSFRISATSQDSTQAIALPDEVERALAKELEARSTAEKLAISAFAIRDVANRSLGKLERRSVVYAAGPSVQIPAGEGQLQAKSLSSAKTVHILHRGAFDQPRDETGPGSLSVLETLPSRFTEELLQQEGARRAALARWIVHPENVLTWRSITNRVWHYHFGRGLCDTPSDFGRMGGTPTHPELLDWLAVWFRDDARGSLKGLHRLIVMSRTYRQSSEIREEGIAIDSENRWLWRQNRHRLDADSFRDFAHSVSGNLDLTMGGPAIQHFRQSKGPQSTPALDYSAYDWNTPGAHRRSIYRYVWRGIADPFMEALDFPDLGLLSPTRGFSTSSLQALALYNNDFVLFQSEAWQALATRSETDLEKQVEFCVRRAWLRSMSDAERNRFLPFAHKHGLQAFCRLLLNSDEFLFVE